jgi:ArsR family transcriptional regulator, arsenate/arsenite/antimonite-responsive transcriptional repressor
MDIYKVLSDPTRREILRLLSNGPMSAGDIAAHFDLSKPTISGHLALLREADFVDITRQGNSLYYNLRMSIVEEATLYVFSYFNSLKRNGEVK